MEKPKKRRFKLKPKVKRTLLIGVSLVMVVYMASLILRQEQQLGRQTQDIAALGGQLETLEETNVELRRTLDFANSDDFLEMIARQQLGYVKEGEIRFVPEDEPLSNDDMNDAEN